MAKSRHQDNKLADATGKKKLILAGLGLTSILSGAQGLHLSQSESSIAQSGIADKMQQQQQQEIQNLMTKALNHVELNTKGDKLTDAQLNSKIIEYMSNQSTSLLQTESEIQQKIFSQFKCVIGANNCLYENQQSLKSGQMKKKAQESLKQSKEKKLSKEKPKHEQPLMDTQDFIEQQDILNKKQKEQEEAAAKQQEQAESAQQDQPEKKMSVEQQNASTSESQKPDAPPEQKQNLQSESDMRLDLETTLLAKSDPNKRLTQKLTAGLKNPVQDIEVKLASKIQHQGENIVIKGDIGTSVFKSPKKNFDIIYASMYHGNANIEHQDLSKQKQSMGEKNKEMGKMSHTSAIESVRKNEMKKGSLNIQLGADEGEQVNMGSVEDAIQDSNQQYALTQGSNATSNSENKELLKKIDLQKLFQKVKSVPVQAIGEKEVAANLEENQNSSSNVTNSSKNFSDVMKKTLEAAIPVKNHAQKSAVQKAIAPLKVPAKHIVSLAQKEPKISEKAPECKPQKAPECPKSDLVQLAQKGNNFKISLSDDTEMFGNQAPEVLEFEVIPKNTQNGVEKGINVLSQEKIMGYQKYLNSINDKSLMQVDDSEFYNVTVSMVLRKGSKFSMPDKVALQTDISGIMEQSQEPPSEVNALVSEVLEDTQEPEDNQNVQIDNSKVTQADEAQRLDVLRREEAEHEQHKKFEARIRKREEAQLNFQSGQKNKALKSKVKEVLQTKETDLFNEDDDAGNLKIVNMAEQKNSNQAEEDQQDREESDATQESQDEEQTSDNEKLKPVVYSTRKAAYPFYINENYLEKKQLLAQEAKQKAELELQMKEEREAKEEMERKRKLEEQLKKEKEIEEQKEKEKEDQLKEIEQTKAKLAKLKAQKKKQTEEEEAKKKQQQIIAQKKQKEIVAHKVLAEQEHKTIALSSTQLETGSSLQERQSYLEEHISAEMAELTKIVNQQKDKSDQESFDFQMLRITKKNGQEIHEEVFEPPAGQQDQSENHIQETKEEHQELAHIKKPQDSKQTASPQVAKLKPDTRVKQLKKALQLKKKLENEEIDDEKILESKSKVKKDDISQVQSKTELNTNNQLTNQIQQASKEKSLEEAKSKLIQTANEALMAKAEVKAAAKYKAKAEKEKEEEEEVRLRLAEQAEKLAKADLETKAKIKKAAQMAAEVQKKTAQGYKDKLEREAKEWLQKKEQLEKEEMAAKQAQDKADQAAKDEQSEKEALQQEAKERAALNQEEALKAETKAQAGALIEEKAKQKVEQVTQEHIQAEKKVKKHQKQEKLKKKAEIKAMEQEEIEEQRMEKEFNEKTAALSKPDIDDFATEMQHLNKESKKVVADSSKDPEPTKKSEDKDHSDEKKQATSEDKLSSKKLKEKDDKEAPHFEGQIDGQSELNAIEKELIDAQKQADAYAKESAQQSALSKLNKTDIVVGNVDQTDKEKPQVKKDESAKDVASKATKDDDNNAENESTEKPEKDNAVQQKSEIKSEAVTSSAQMAENQAVAEVRAAEKEGEKRGSVAAQKMLKSQKNMTKQQTQAQLESLKKKLTNTSHKVSAIIQHFSQVHDQITELKNEFIQQQQEGLESKQEADEEQEDEKVQLSQSVKVGEGILSSLKQSILEKQNEMKQMMGDFKSIKGELGSIESGSPQINKLRDNIALQISEQEKTAQKDLNTDVNLLEIRQSEEQNGGDVEDIQLNEEDSLSSDELERSGSKTNSEAKSLNTSLVEAKKQNQIVQERLEKLLSES